MVKKKKLDGRQEVMLGFAQSAAERWQHFFYVLIPESLGPLERCERYEIPLNDALGELGGVVGGGSQMGEDNGIAFCGLDVVVNDRERGLKLIRECLLACGAPQETLIEEYVPAFAQMRIWG